MQRRMFLAAAGGMLVLPGCGEEQMARTGAASGAERPVVVMGLSSFTPDAITITQGETVHWRNSSAATHTVTADPARAANASNVQLPSGAQAFHSGDIAPGESWEYAFNVPGTYRYVCLPHEQMGMSGTVVAQPQ